MVQRCRCSECIMYLVFGSGSDSLGKMPTNVATSRLSKKRKKPELEMMCSREWSKCERFTRWASFFEGVHYSWGSCSLLVTFLSFYGIKLEAEPNGGTNGGTATGRTQPTQLQPNNATRDDRCIGGKPRSTTSCYIIST